MIIAPCYLPYEAPETTLTLLKVRNRFLKISTGEGYGNQQPYDGDWEEEDD